MTSVSKFLPPFVPLPRCELRTHLLIGGVRLAADFQIPLEIEGVLMQTLPVALIHDIAVSLMGVGVVLIIHERVGTGDEQDCL